MPDYDWDEYPEEDYLRDRCYECQGYGDDYYVDESGELVSACDDCLFNGMGMTKMIDPVQKAFEEGYVKGREEGAKITASIEHELSAIGKCVVMNLTRNGIFCKHKWMLYG